MVQLIRSTIATVVILIVPALPSDAVAQFSSPRLLFAQQDGDVCNIRYWHEFASEAVILARTDTCPERLFVDSRRQTVFVVDGDMIRALRIYPLAEAEPIAMPDRDYRTWLDSMDPRPDRNDDYQPGTQFMQPIGIRHLEDGALGVVMSLGMPADDEYHYLFRSGDDGWSIVASRWCDRWGCPEQDDISDPFHPGNYLSTRGSGTWPEERMIWSPALLYSEYVTYRNEKKHEIAPGAYEGAILEIGLKIDGEESVLTTYVSPSAHSDTLHTFSVDLRPGSGPAKNLSRNQCMTSIVGRYILVYEFFRGRFELTDLATGETVFSNLSTAAWID